MHRAVVLLTIGLLGCDRGVEVTPTSDAGAFDAIVDPGPAIARCGPGPYVMHYVSLTKDEATGAPFPGVRVAIDRCPDVVVTTDAKGAAQLATTVGVPYDVLLDPPERTPVAIGQYAARIHGTTDGIPEKLAWWNPKAPVVQVTALGTGACADSSNLRVSIDGHPEAVVHYFVAGEDRMGPTASPADIVIEGLPDGLVFRLQGDKPGCTTGSGEGYFGTGWSKTHAGRVTYATIELVAGDAGP